jgi:hypothetical protein
MVLKLALNSWAQVFFPPQSPECQGLWIHISMCSHPFVFSEKNTTQSEVIYCVFMYSAKHKECILYAVFGVRDTHSKQTLPLSSRISCVNGEKKNVKES